MLPALYRFLYCCGVRCGEARKLKCENVHLKEGYVDILDTKSHRDRRLYLSEELISYLLKYDKAVSACFPEREYFFPGSIHPWNGRFIPDIPHERKGSA